MNFESAEFYNINDYNDLYEHIKNIIINKDKFYILLDEVQNISQ